MLLGDDVGVFDTDAPADGVPVLLDVPVGVILGVFVTLVDGVNEGVLVFEGVTHGVVVTDSVGVTDLDDVPDFDGVIVLDGVKDDVRLTDGVTELVRVAEVDGVTVGLRVFEGVTDAVGLTVFEEVKEGVFEEEEELV